MTLAAVSIMSDEPLSMVEPLSLPDRLGVIRELMESLDVVTRSGQDHVMHKLVRILREEMLREGLSLSSLQLGAAMNALTELEHEAGRVTPMPDVFNDNARVLVGLLAQASTMRRNS